MICEKCGCHDRVMRTVRKDDKVVRYRRCIACSHVVKTEETKLETPEVPAKESKGTVSSEPKKKRGRPKKKVDRVESNEGTEPMGALEKALASAD